MINHKNYEIWFLDFAEGNLSERQIELLMDFLDRNEDLKAEFDEMEMIELPADEAFTFDEKAMLKRPLTADISLSNIDKLLIGELEGDLNTKEKAQLKALLMEQPDLAKAQNIYQKSLLWPDLAVKYPNKDELKRKERKVIPLRWVIQAAAAILLLMVMIFALRKRENAQSVELPIVEVPAPKVPIQISPEVQNPVIMDEVAEAPKPIIEQASVPLPKPRRVAPKIRATQVEQPLQIIPENKSVEAIVNQEPKSPKPQAPRMQSPPKPQLEPLLPESKPVIAFKKPTNQAPKAILVTQETPSNTRLIALNKPKDFLKNAVDKSIKKMAKQADTKARLSVPEAIVATVGAITKKKTSYEHTTRKNSKKISVSFGKFKFSRVKHRSR